MGYDFIFKIGFDVLLLIGGLALFLLGMNQMGDGLEKACGNKMKAILEKLTSNRFVGVLVGMGITMVIQSSSATTVMVVGFVNAGMMSLTQAVWIIMGANIGTTITGQLVALDIGGVAPVVAIIGVVMMLFIKKKKVNEIGMIFCGFGVLFIGMEMMGYAMKPLGEMESFVNLMTKFSNVPILGILVGTIFTAIIQSSSASVGILQALANSGAIGFDSAIYILFGQNIGTCVTALLASIGTSRAAKRTTIIHFSFNIIGTILFTTICLLTNLEDLVKNLSKDNPAQQIANMHTLFNISTTLVLLPFGGLLVKMAKKILPDIKTSKDGLFMYLNNDIDLGVGMSAIHMQNTMLEINRMYQLAINNIKMSYDSLIEKNTLNEKKIIETEELIDKLNEGIVKEVTKCMSKNPNVEVSEAYSVYLTISQNIERLSDHALNLFEHYLEFNKRNVEINDTVKDEIIQMKNITFQMIDVALNPNEINTCLDLETKIDDLTIKFKENMLDRLKKSICTAEGSIIYSSILIDFERIGDHLLNISENIFKIK